MREETVKQNEKLIRLIQEEPCYQDYLNLEKRVSAEPDLKNRLDQFRRANQFYRQDASSVQQYDQLQAMYREISAIPVARAYLEAEAQVCALIQRMIHAWEAELQLPQL